MARTPQKKDLRHVRPHNKKPPSENYLQTVTWQPSALLSRYYFNCFIDWNKLTSEELDVLNHNASIIRLGKNQLVFEEASLPKGVYVLLSGKVKIFHFLADGTYQIHLLCAPGELFGFRALLCAERHPVSASALEDSRILFIPSDDFLKVVHQSPALSNLLLTAMSRNFLTWINRINMLTNMDVRQRLAIVLLMLNEKFKPRQSLLDTSAINVSRTDLAAMVGTSLETLVRMLKRFSNEGLVKVRGKNIVIAGMKKMMAIAGIN